MSNPTGDALKPHPTRVEKELSATLDDLAHAEQQVVAVLLARYREQLLAPFERLCEDYESIGPGSRTGDRLREIIDMHRGVS